MAKHRSKLRTKKPPDNPATPPGCLSIHNSTPPQVPTRIIVIPPDELAPPDLKPLLAEMSPKSALEHWLVSHGGLPAESPGSTMALAARSLRNQLTNAGDHLSHTVVSTQRRRRTFSFNWELESDDDPVDEIIEILDHAVTKTEAQPQG